MQRYAIYYAPPDGPFADAAARWLGWDPVRGVAVVQPDLPGLQLGLAEITADPRKYGFHGTMKAPFRLASGVTAGDLEAALRAFAAHRPGVVLEGLRMVNLEGFLAFVPEGDQAALNALAADVVLVLDPLRAPLSEGEVARRRPERLTARQRELLALHGYPHVLEEFRFHLTLSGPLDAARAPEVAAAAKRHFDGLVPRPFPVADLCLMGEALDGRFHLLHRVALAGV